MWLLIHDEIEINVSNFSKSGHLLFSPCNPNCTPLPFTRLYEIWVMLVCSKPFLDLMCYRTISVVVDHFKSSFIMMTDQVRENKEEFSRYLFHIIFSLTNGVAFTFVDFLHRKLPCFPTNRTSKSTNFTLWFCNTITLKTFPTWMFLTLDHTCDFFRRIWNFYQYDINHDFVITDVTTIPTSTQFGDCLQ